MASAMFWPCETSTSICRNFATISSGAYLFLGISVLLDAKRHSSSRTTSKGEDQTLSVQEQVGLVLGLGVDDREPRKCHVSRSPSETISTHISTPKCE